MRRHHFLGRIPFQLDPSCKLWLPFRRYGSEQSKIWDISGNNNHGIITGAVPAQIPTLSGVALVANGGMEDGDPPTGWSAYNSPETFEQSGVQKHTGSYSTHIVDSTPSRGGFYQTISIITNKQYKVSFWYYIVSGSIRVELDYPSVYDLLSKTGSWCYFEKIFTRIATYSRIYFYNSSTSVAAEFYIDDVSVQEVVGSTGLGWSFDGVDDVIDCGNVCGFAAGSSLSVMGWFQLLTPPTSTLMLIAKGTEAVAFDWNVGMNMTTQRLFFGNDGGSTPVATNEFLLNTWKHFAVTNDGTNAYGYMNGVYETTGVRSNSGPTAQTLKIGNNGAYKCNGAYGEVLIFNRALSAQEIRDYFERTRHIYGV